MFLLIKKVRKTLRRIEKKALERDLDLDLIRSFSCGHLADLRKEDIKYTNMRIKRTTTNLNSFSTEDIDDLYMPKSLETYKLKMAIEKERKGRGWDQHISNSGRTLSTQQQTPSKNYLENDSPVRSYHESFITEFIIRPTIVTNDEFVFNKQLITSPPPIQIKSPFKSPNIKSPNQIFRHNPNNMFAEILHDRLKETDRKIANAIIESPKRPKVMEKVKEEDDVDESMSDDAGSTDQDQDEFSSSDDLNMDEEDLRNFDMNPSPSKYKQKKTKPGLALRNPGELISDFYISNMNYAMRYSVDYIQKVARNLRERRNEFPTSQTIANRTYRSLSADCLYAVRRENIRFMNGADETLGAKLISFTTDDIQDIYMPSAIDNYKRKIAVELERRRRLETSNMSAGFLGRQRLFSPVHMDYEDTPYVPSHSSVLLDDFDMILLNKAKITLQNENDLDDKVLKSFQPVIQVTFEINQFICKILKGL